MKLVALFLIAMCIAMMFVSAYADEDENTLSDDVSGSTSLPKSFFQPLIS